MAENSTDHSDDTPTGANRWMDTNRLHVDPGGARWHLTLEWALVDGMWEAVGVRVRADTSARGDYLRAVTAEDVRRIPLGTIIKETKQAMADLVVRGDREKINRLADRAAELKDRLREISLDQPTDLSDDDQAANMKKAFDLIKALAELHGARELKDWDGDVSVAGQKQLGEALDRLGPIGNAFRVSWPMPDIDIYEEDGTPRSVARLRVAAAWGPHRGRALTVDELQFVADVYNTAKATYRPTTKAVAAACNVSEGTANKRIKRAKELGLIPERSER